MNSLLQYLVRGLGLMASLGLFLLTLVVIVYAFVEGGFVVAEILQFSDSEYSVIYDTMTVLTSTPFSDSRSSMRSQSGMFGSTPTNSS